VLFSFDGGDGAIPVGIGGRRGDGGDALFLGCGGSGGPLSLRNDDGLETLLLGGGCGGDTLLLDLSGGSNALFLGGAGGGGSFTFSSVPLSLRYDGSLDPTLLDGDPITLLGGGCLGSLGLEL